MKLQNWIYLSLLVVIVVFLIWLWSLRNQHTYTVMENQNYSLIQDSGFEIGQKIDSLNGVYVYFNGVKSNVSGRSTTKDGYSLGQKYQCVEFIKRYYYKHLNFKMPETYGHAIDFFDKTLKDGEENSQRGLTQFNNPSTTKPNQDAIIIYNTTSSNQYGHVAIVSKVMDDKIEIIQQNPGINASSRATYSLQQKDGKWEIDNHLILGWLTKKK